MFALVGDETVVNELNVGTELRDFFVWEQIVIEGRLQALLNKSQEYTIRHVAMTRWNRVIGVRKYTLIMF